MSRLQISMNNSPDGPVVKVNDVHKSYRRVHAVAGVSIEVAAGEFVAVLGPNGAGKTTLVEMIEGLHAPDRGSIMLFGLSWSEGEKMIRPNLGLALQETRFMDRVTVTETIYLFASFYGCPRSRGDELIELVNLEEKRQAYTMNLSHGQRQKLALAIALLNQPSLLILDEPTTGLDPISRRELWEILTGLKSKGTALILTTHYMEEAEYLCDRIYILDRGRVLAEGSLDELLAQAGLPEIVEFSLPGIKDLQLFSELPGLMDASWNRAGAGVLLKVRSTTEFVPRLLALLQDRGLNMSRLQCRRPNLNDLFAAKTGRSLNE